MYMKKQILKHQNIWSYNNKELSLVFTKWVSDIKKTFDNPNPDCWRTEILKKL